MKFAIFAWTIAAALCAVSSAVSAAEPVDYERDVKPVLTARCYACHGALKQESELRLDTGEAIRAGGASGPAVVIGSPSESSLIARISAADPSERMPPEGEPLTPEEIAHITAWIEQGANSPEGELPAEDPRTFWSFQPIARPAMPAVEGVSNSIDAFLAAAHADKGLSPMAPAERHALARRVFVDLLGVPPEPEELREFLADSSPRAYEALVDKLLASPRYAERWGRHWMDVWRYSDWYGRRAEGEIRYSQRHIWRWRDWIIESLAADKGYDQMIVEMLAADEAAPSDPLAARATGFLARNWYKFDRDVWLFETVEQTSVAFLGVTMRCCRCHDHKFDPVSQNEYYRLRAFFEPHDVRIDPPPAGDMAMSQGETSAGLARIYDKTLEAPTWFYPRGEPRQADKEHPLVPATPAMLGGGELAFQGVSLPIEAYYPALAPEVVAATIADAEKRVANAEAAGDPLDIASARASLASLRARIDAERARLSQSLDAPALAKVAGAAERAATIAVAEASLAAAERERASLDASSDQTAIAAAVEQADKKIAEAKQSLEAARAAETAALAAPDSPEAAKYPPLGESYPATSSGRRLALAKWIASEENPRTARVAVNHIWLRHFGEPLVPTVNNFGLGGKKPALPELLDWLATELIENGWSMKHLHRLIVTSDAYRRSSDARHEANLAIDPENRYLWRMNSRRMEAETIRDSVLAVSAGLDLKIGGPELEETLGQTSRRRSLYFRITPDNKMEMLELFDLANPNECYRRSESVTPQQSLALTNSALAQSEARKVAQLISREEATQFSPDAFIEAAFERILCRPPTDQERSLCLQFLQDASTAENALTAFPPSPQPPAAAPANDAAQRAREELVQVLLNHHEFLTIR